MSNAHGSSPILAYVYYRDLPAAISDFVVKNKDLTYTKDGVIHSSGQSAPRLTIRVKTDAALIEQSVKTRLDKLLLELVNNNQIVTYNIFL